MPIELVTDETWFVDRMIESNDDDRGYTYAFEFLIADEVFSLTLPATGMGTCLADVDDDGLVEIRDLIAVLAAWGPCAQCREDIDGVAPSPSVTC